MKVLEQAAFGPGPPREGRIQLRDVLCHPEHGQRERRAEQVYVQCEVVVKQPAGGEP
jgi:hypothetical protein